MPPSPASALSQRSIWNDRRRSNLVTGARSGGTDSQPPHIKAVAEAALKRLRSDHVYLF